MESGKAAAREAMVPLAEPHSVPPPEFLRFFREQYVPLLKVVMYAGATYYQADDAVASTMEELLRRWSEIVKPFAYSRKAAVTNFVKAKTRCKYDNESRELIPDPGAHDPALNLWEDRQWVSQLLDSLPSMQRTVMVSILDGFTATEIAKLLGRTPEAVRQNLLHARRRLQQHEAITALHVSRMPSSPREEDE